MKLCLPILLQVLLVPLMLHGQAPSTVEFRVTRFDPLDGKPPEFRTRRGDGSKGFEVPLTYIAGPFKTPLRDGIFLDLWHGTMNPDETALQRTFEEGERPDISVRIEPAERKELLLVFVPEDDGFRILKIPTPRDRIKGGDRLIINTTRTELALRLGDMKTIWIPPNKSGVLKGPPGNTIVSLPVQVSRKVSDKWKLASSENWPCDPRFRKILFAYMEPGSRQLAFHAVREAAAPEADSSETKN